MKRMGLFLLLLYALPALAQQPEAPVYQLSDGRRMDSAFKKLLVQYPERDNAVAERYDNLRTYIAMVFAMERNNALAETYIASLKTGVTKGNHYFRLAGAFDRAGDSTMAEKYAKLSVDSCVLYIADNFSNAGQEVTPASTLAASLTLLTSLLDNKKEYKEAIRYLSAYTGYCSEKNAIGLQILKADMLIHAGSYSDAVGIYRRLMKSKTGGHVAEAGLKKAYVAMHEGSVEGFDSYLAAFKDEVQQVFRDSIRRTSLKVKAPLFSLYDMDGKSVSLKDYEGKVVVLDFWATWCVPCKASFPAMQKAVNKYAADKNVVFLFIDTWEYSADPLPQIKQFMTNKGYGFTVLLDAKNKSSGKCEVVEKYGADGIPAKFVIDKEGYIRYKLKGFNTSDEEAVADLSEMINLAALH